ncbi:MAG: dihydropteroate synthase [Spirochaetales bacterium]|nr:dihydropteroate synthase [Spirochaetales bacterium]
MGVVNCTPDSFFPGSRTEGRDAAIERGLEMVAAGADILDIGGESTRPGSDPVGPAVELERVIPVIEGLQGRVQVPLSIDTRDAAVADAALEAGAELLNDISALLGDPRMGEVAARRGVPVVLMHMRGEPKTMQEAPYYRDTIGEVQAELQAAVDRALGAGIRRERIILDPGIGFGKRLQDNLRLLGRLECLRALGCPLLVGVSRKSFIGRVLDLPVEERLIGTVAANTIAVLNGADILRVHDVAAAVQVVRMVEAVRQASVREGA